MSPEQREVEQEEGCESREESQDSPIASADDIQLYDNQISTGTGEGGQRWVHEGEVCIDEPNSSSSSSNWLPVLF